MDRSGYRPHRSLLWPILLIGIGLLWLLNSLGTIAAISLPYLFHLWPLLLIFLGLDVLLGRRSHLVGAVLGVVAVVVLVTVAIAGPMIGLERNIQVKTEHFTAPLDGATAASIHLTFSDSPVEIGSLPDPGVLMDARLRYIGLINFQGQRDGEENGPVKPQRGRFSPVQPDLLGSGLELADRPGPEHPPRPGRGRRVRGEPGRPERPGYQHPESIDGVRPLHVHGPGGRRQDG